MHPTALSHTAALRRPPPRVARGVIAPTPTLTAREHAAVAALIARVVDRDDPPLLHALLFGSKARGDFDAASDVDVMLICDMDPEERRAAAAALAREADDVARATGVALEPWAVACADLEEGWRTPMLVDALEDGLPLWPPGAPPIRLPFTEADARFCAGCLLDWVYEGGTEARAALADGRWADAARRARDDITRLATAALLLEGDTRHRNVGSLRRFRRRFVQTDMVAPVVLPALAWAESAYAALPRHAGEAARLSAAAAETAPAGCRLAAVLEAVLVPWILDRMRALPGPAAATSPAAAPPWAPPPQTAAAPARC